LSSRGGDAAHGQETMLVGLAIPGPFFPPALRTSSRQLLFSLLSPRIRDALVSPLGGRIPGATAQLQTALASRRGGPNTIRREALEVLNDKPLISPGIYVNHAPRAGRSRALHSEKNCLIGRVWILSACLVSGALGLPAAFSGWGIS